MTLDDIAVIIGGGTPDTKIAKYWNGDIQWFTPSEIKSNYVSKSERTITELGLSKSSAKLLPIGAILITTRATIGEVAIATEECSTNQGFQSLIVNKNTNNIFIANWIAQNKSELIRRAKGSTFAEISKSEIERIQIILPRSLNEQAKIASLLRRVDERIATQSKIIEKYESLMKGLIISFVKGKELNALLKDCLTCHASTLMESAVAGNIGEYPVYGAAGIIARTAHYEINEDAILIIKDGASVGKVQYSTGKYSVIGTLNYLTSKSKVSLKYFYYYLQVFNFDKYKVGSGIPHIYFKDYGIESVYCPSIEEQNKMANFLSAIDEKLETEKQILNKFTEQKKYLLANMFV